VFASLVRFVGELALVVAGSSGGLLSSEMDALFLKYRPNSDV